MGVEGKPIKLALSSQELRLLVDSLEHCLATCKEKTHDAKAACTDCAAAAALRARLQQSLGA